MRLEEGTGGCCSTRTLLSWVERASQTARLIMAVTAGEKHSSHGTVKAGQERRQVIPIFDFNPVNIYRRIKTKQLIRSETPPDMPFCPQFHNEGPN